MAFERLHPMRESSPGVEIQLDVLPSHLTVCDLYFICIFQPLQRNSIDEM